MEIAPLRGARGSVRPYFRTAKRGSVSVWFSPVRLDVDPRHDFLETTVAEDITFFYRYVSPQFLPFLVGFGVTPCFVESTFAASACKLFGHFFASVCQPRDFVKAPDVIGQSSRHRGRDPQRFVSPGEIVVDEVERNPKRTRLAANAPFVIKVTNACCG